ncbi:BREX-1 system adenine-specific DNA-methyltransferase PglX [Laspinema olomoucense]|uniref:BREX-1 system adenine-specific DNA-methyltransferase PglX n=1 Tax=Laspinema olomoucense TaxID=3231600 RepID=UPI0021BA3CF9|nr:BREX-1 system adenine-specific DNA-methyltransferase PglX [Laspinema sp. D3d]MCT7974554.1 BREX-1 system adenine-specific DNA-methyltransferase PglX [Laspinema sp. D3d]
MGRHFKKVETKIGIDRRETGYYSTPDFVAEFITQALIELNPQGRTALDPCVGRGEMVIPLLNEGISVDGMDILPFDLPDSIQFTQTDFLRFYQQNKLLSILNTPINLDYDFYLANPPYNCHEVAYIRNNKTQLSRLFGDIGVHNMYALFIAALIDCAKPGALIGLITLDSFLTAKAHQNLRHKILQNCAVHYLILCSNDLFLAQGADVRTCIMILQKGNDYQGAVKVANRPLNQWDFQRMLIQKQWTELPIEKITLAGEADHSEFIIDIPDEIRNLFESPRLGNRFPCVTGISTGSDRTYLSKHPHPGFTIPFYKNPGSCRFFTKPNAYLIDDFLSVAETIPNFTIRNKSLLYQPGITCSSMGVTFSACYLPAHSTYGVNANIITLDSDTWWLLAYLNSHLVTFIVRSLLNRSNMITSGYVARIPIPKLSPIALHKMSAIAREAYQKQVSPKAAIQYVEQINQIIWKELDFTADTLAIIQNFCKNLIRAT